MVPLLGCLDEKKKEAIRKTKLDYSAILPLCAVRKYDLNSGSPSSRKVRYKKIDEDVPIDKRKILS